MEYQVVCENDADALVTTINEMIAEGWRPVGGFTAVPAEETRPWIYFQAMIQTRDAEPPIEFKGPPSFVHPDRMPEPDFSQEQLGMTSKADPSRMTETAGHLGNAELGHLLQLLPEGYDIRHCYGGNWSSSWVEVHGDDRIVRNLVCGTPEALLSELLCKIAAGTAAEGEHACA